MFEKIERYKAQIDAIRPFEGIILQQIKDYYRIGLTYSSNALEGSSLTETETKILLEDGLTVGGKPIRDYYEAAGHSKAYDFMFATANEQPLVISEKIIKKLHFLFYNAIDYEQAGKYRKTQAFITGTEFLPPSPRQVPALMKNYVQKMNKQKAILHPVEFAAMLHKDLVDIHPFIDGNGRTARLLMNLAMINSGYGIVIIPPVLRGDYITALKISQRKTGADNGPFIKLVAECLEETQKDMLRLLNG
ncbi:MAG: Fic family protein [Syntrophomonas sp.]